MRGLLTGLRLLTLSFALLFPFIARAVDFTILASREWKKISQDGENAIFRDLLSQSNETIILQAFRPQAKDVALIENLTTGKLTTARSKMMDRFGIGNYTALEITHQPIEDSRIKKLVVIESLFRDLKNRDVQMVERQYLSSEKMYIITYLIDAPAINDRKRVFKILDQFRPNILSSVSANENAPSLPSVSIFQMLDQTISLLPSAHASEVAESSTPLSSESNSNSAVAASLIHENKLSASDIEQNCQNVPIEKRRTAADVSFLSLAQTTLLAPKSCILGIADNAWSIVKGAYDIGAAEIKYTFDSGYRSEVNSTIGVVVAEIKKDPKEFARRVVGEIYSCAQGAIGDFFGCLKPSEQIRTFCNLASNLIPAGLLAKILTRAPLTAVEISRVAKLAKDALGLKSAKTIDEVATINKTAITPAQSADLVESPKGFSVESMTDAKNAPSNSLDLTNNGKPAGQVDINYKPDRQALEFSTNLYKGTDTEPAIKSAVKNVLDLYPNTKTLETSLFGEKSKIQALREKGISCADAVRATAMYAALVAGGFSLNSAQCGGTPFGIFEKVGFNGANTESLANGDKAFKQFLLDDEKSSSAITNNPNAIKFADVPSSRAATPRDVIEQRLSNAERNAIYGYTKDSYAKNELMRTGNQQVWPEYPQMASGIEKLPAYSGITYRGTRLTPSQLANLQRPNAIFKDSGFLSSSMDFTTAEHHATKVTTSSDGLPSVVFVIKGRSGRSIENASASLHRMEREVVFPSGTQFHVDIVQRRTDGSYLVFLEEAP
jgi:hypothetical protein